MAFALLLVLLGATLVSVSDYRKGMVVIAATGLLQDLVRKLSPGQPAYLMGLVFVSFAATLFGALSVENPRWWRRRDWKGLQTPIRLFGLVLFVQAAVSYLRIGSFVLIALGLAAYAGPVAAIVLGSWAGSARGVVERFLGVYLVIVMVMASGVVFYEAGLRWPSLMSIGPGLTVYDWQLGAIYLPPGFFRAPEVASWHCATGACVAIVLATVGKVTPTRSIVLGGLATFLTWCVVVTGRRKGLGELVIFLAVFVFLQLWIRGRLGKLGGAVLVAILLGALAFQRYGLQEKVAGQIGSMIERTEASGGAGGRFVGGVMSLPDVIRAAGLLGTGLGTGTQGSQHFRAEGEQWSAISEGGLARMVAELGLPGSLVALLLLYRFGRNIKDRASGLRRRTARETSSLLGLMALLASNSVIFVSAHQIFGDPFVYLFLGLVAGFVVAGLDEEELAEWRARRLAPPMPAAA